ncbi:MAG: IS5 family transposase [Candidatus Dormibacteria bacterium]
MQALDQRVLGAIWTAFSARLPPRPPDRHPLHCHRHRFPDRACFEAIVFRLVTGCSWSTAGRLGQGGATTLRTRRDQWLAAGAFDAIFEEALRGYDKIIGLDCSETAIDGSQQKAPCGGEGTGPNPTDRGKSGWKWSVATERNGVPLGWVTDAANRNDCVLLAPTLDAVAARGLLPEIGTLHLDRGYDNQVVRQECARRGLTDVVIAQKRQKGKAKTKKLLPLGERWPVERTNSWLTNYGLLRRSTDRRVAHRQAMLALATAFILVIKLFIWADRWNR